MTEENKYQVHLNNFDGPLDLLLHLIEKNKVDIYDIPIVEITNQYMEYIKAMEEKDLNIALKFECRDDFVTHEHYELMNIFKNLITNAIEAIEGDEKGDTITLEQALVDDEFIFVVKDNGPGISKRHLPNIFKMGYSTKFDYVTGNIYRGVGLCGVKNTVEEQFGGSIKVDSVFGDGTQFTIRVPKDSISVTK